MVFHDDDVRSEVKKWVAAVGFTHIPEPAMMIKWMIPENQTSVLLDFSNKYTLINLSRNLGIYLQDIIHANFELSTVSASITRIPKEYVSIP